MNTYVVTVQRQCSSRANPANHTALVVVNETDEARARTRAVAAVRDASPFGDAVRNVQVVAEHTALVVRL